MSKILEGYQAFKEIHQGNRNPSEEINHLMIDTIRLFENLIETNWELVSELIVLQGNSFDSEE
jgi:predicted SnoaL-like aldol condensation-catalyzing enzyme